MRRYACFLRGINVGGRNIVAMADVRRAFEAAGMSGVTTVLASGNLIFDSTARTVDAVERAGAPALRAAVGREIGLFVRSLAQLRALVDAAPFAGVEMTAAVRLYVTFLRTPPEASAVAAAKAAGMIIVAVRESEVCSVVTVGEDGNRTVDTMSALERAFGKQITTRNWKTVQKVLERGAPASSTPPSTPRPSRRPPGA